MQATATASNLGSYYFGRQAALLAGAVTADTETGGATWYNPAGLARVDSARLDASISAYALRFGGDPDFDGVGPDLRSAMRWE